MGERIATVEVKEWYVYRSTSTHACSHVCYTVVMCACMAVFVSNLPALVVLAGL